MTPKSKKSSRLRSNKQLKQPHRLPPSKDIVWNPQAGDDTGKKALPEALKGREEISWQDARSQLNEKFDGFLGNKDLPLSDDQKRATVEMLMNLNQAVTPRRI
ncbi:MAG: hypothetical protein R3C24_00405 [Cyanobacteriota/Melainabacteria group bacterium]